MIISRRALRADRRWLAVLLLGATNCLAFSDRALLGLLAPAMKASLALSDLMIGLLSGTAFVVPYVAGMVLFASAGDGIARLRAIRLSLIGWTAATVVCGLAHSAAALLAARALLGLAQAPLAPAGSAYLAAAAPDRLIGRAVSVFTAGATLGRSTALLGGGAALAFVGIPLLGADEGWRAVFALSAVPAVLLLVLLSLPEEPPLPPASAGAQGRAVRLWLRDHCRAYATHTVASAMAVLVIQTLTAWATTLLVRRHGLSVAAAGSAFGTLVLVLAPAGHLCGGAALDALRRRTGGRAPGLIIGAALAAGAPAVALFGLAPGLDGATLGAALATFGLGLASPAALTGVQLMTPPGLRTRIGALFMACIAAAGFGIGPPALGVLTDHVFGPAGIGEALALVAACAAGIGLLAVAVQLGGPVPDPSGRGSDVPAAGGRTGEDPVPRRPL